MTGFRLYSALAVFIFAPSGAMAQGSPVDSIAVHRAHMAWFDGLLAEDTAMLSAILTEDVTLGFPGGNVMPRSDFLRYLQGSELYYDSAEHHDLRIRIFGSAAAVNGGSTLSYRFRESTGSERLTYTATYIRAGDKWRMVAWQSTVPPRR